MTMRKMGTKQGNDENESWSSPPINMTVVIAIVLTRVGVISSKAQSCSGTFASCVTGADVYTGMIGGSL